jgi:pimeloyl-ACP methyl ester carboxylesterase
MLSFLLSACFGKYFMSDKEIEAYYKSHQPKPQFLSYDTLETSIHFAFANPTNDSLPLLILIHGAPGAWYGYIEFLEDSFLLRNFRIISVDRPGYGKSNKKRPITSIEEQAKLLKPLVKLAKGKPCFVLGRSYGAPIAACMAYDNPTAINGLFLIAPAADPKLEKFWWFSKPVYYPPLRWIFPKVIRTASDEKFAHQKELNKILPIWSSINQNAVIAQGGKDFIIYRQNGNFVDSLMTCSSHCYYFLPQNGHLITKENPQFVKEKLIELLKLSSN